MTRSRRGEAMLDDVSDRVRRGLVASRRRSNHSHHRQHDGIMECGLTEDDSLH